MSKLITQKLNDKYNYSKIEKDIDIIKKKLNWDLSVKKLEKYFQKLCQK